MKLDFRKKAQYITNNFGKNIYIWKEHKNLDYVGQISYSVGINGTSSHFGGIKRENVIDKIYQLMNVK